MAAGAVVFGRVDARDAVEHVPRRGGALALEVFAANHVPGARVFEHIGLSRFAQPVADHCGGAQLDACGHCGRACRLQAERTFTLRAGLQASAFEQGVQPLFGAEVTVEATALQAAGSGRTE